MKKIALISFRYGKWPPWLHLTLESCARNSDVDWILVGDPCPNTELPANVRFIRLSLPDLVSRISASTGARATIRPGNVYKICEFKPAFGAIFADLLEGYDFWGHVDLDVIWGDVRAFLTDPVLSSYDVISTAFHLAGCCTVFANTPAIRQLYRSDPGYRALFEDESYNVFDEIGRREKHYCSMDRIVRREQSAGKLRVLWGNSIIVDVHRKEWEARDKEATGLSEIPGIVSGAADWREGKLVHRATGREALYHHFMIWKQSMSVPRCRRWHHGLRSMAIEEQGFSLQFEDRWRTLLCGLDRSVSRVRHGLGIGGKSAG